MSQFGRFGGGLQMTDVVKNIIIINVAVFVATLVYPSLTGLFALHYPSTEAFRPFQLVTHMFTHANLWMDTMVGGEIVTQFAPFNVFHILFNMYALFSFGSILERVIGPKRFVFLYFFSGFGAIALHFGISAVMAYVNAGTVVITPEMAIADPELLDIYRQSVVGASGAIYGTLAAFGMFFPNAPLMFMFIPVPIKAKYMIPLVIIIYDIAFAQYGLDNVAHYAHIGGALAGFLLVLYWNKSNKKTLW